MTEAVGGTISGSLAILCDAAHQLSDVAGFVISFLAIYLTRKPSTMKQTYGYHRADVIGALGSILIIWGLLIWLLTEAVKRLMDPGDVDGEIMLITAIFGLGCNILNIVILNCCCNNKGEQGEKVHLFESIASAYKPMHGNKIASEIRSVKSKSNKGSVLSRNTGSVLDNYDADEAGNKAKADPEEPETPKLMDQSTRKMLNGTTDAESPLLAKSGTQSSAPPKS